MVWKEEESVGRAGKVAAGEGGGAEVRQVRTGVRVMAVRQGTLPRRVSARLRRDFWSLGPRRLPSRLPGAQLGPRRRRRRRRRRRQPVAPPRGRRTPNPPAPALWLPEAEGECSPAWAVAAAGLEEEEEAEGEEAEVEGEEPPVAARTAAGRGEPPALVSVCRRENATAAPRPLQPGARPPAPGCARVPCPVPCPHLPSLPLRTPGLLRALPAWGLAFLPASSARAAAARQLPLL